MPRQVEIHVEGLAFCFLRDRIWHLIFVSDLVHPLLLEDPDNTRTPLRVGEIDLTCEFLGTRVAQTGAITFPNGKIPNLSAPSGHDKDGGGLSNLTLARSHNQRTAMLTIQLPESTLEIPTGFSTKADCWIQEVRSGGGGRKTNLKRVKTKVIFRFEIQSDENGGLTVQVTHRQTGDVYSQTFPKSATTGPLVFKFNNGCDGFCTHNDSIDLYDVFKDKRNNNLQFVTGSLKNNNVPGHDPNNPSPIGTGKKMLSPTYGNCDPVGSEPPPEGTWPPA